MGSEKHWEAWLFDSQNPEELSILSLGRANSFPPCMYLLRFSFLDCSKRILCPYFLAEEEKRVFNL